MNGNLTAKLSKATLKYIERSAIYGTNSVHFLGSLIWLNILPNLVNSSRSISEVKDVIKKIGNIDCGWMICRR